jgi:hypothetical protein
MNIYGEKMYRLQYAQKEPEIHVKGIMRGLFKELKNPENYRKLYAEANTVIIQSGFRRNPGGGINLETMTRFTKNGVQPRKRAFVDSNHSITY